MDRIRNEALKIIVEVLDKGAYTNIALNKLLKEGLYSPLERRFITELAYGTIKHKGELTWVLDQFSKKKDIDTWVYYILLLGIYQILHMDRVPHSAACNESVKLAKKHSHLGSAKFVNGVLRSIVRNVDQIQYPDIEKDPAAHLAVVYSHPLWLVKRWIAEYGVEDTRALCEYNNTKKANTIRVNTLKCSIDEVKGYLKENNTDVKDANHVPEGLIIDKFDQLDRTEAFNQGFFVMQDEASMITSRCVAPKEGSFVIDACAAPGSKTTHLAQLMKDQGKIVACDIHEHRLALLRENVKKLGITSITTENMEAQKIGQRYEKQADSLLLDVPCSGLGVLRGRPDLRWKKKPEQIKELAKVQFEIIQGAAKAVKPGGTIVYSTCTMTHEENIDVINRFLEGNRDFHFSTLTPWVPATLLKDGDLADTAQRGYIQLLPQHHNMDGFFICRLVRKEHN